MTQYLSANSILPAFMAFPKFLLERTSLNETAKIVYMILLDRAKLSQKDIRWSDERGAVYIYYPIRDLAKMIYKSETSVKTALAVLEQSSLIVRKRQGLGKANRIYVLLPIPKVKNLSPKQTESCPFDGKKAVGQTERKLSGSKINKSKNNIVKRVSKAYGTYRNVLLSEDELSALQQEIPQYQQYIERLSTYMKSTGKRYADHAATIRRWYRQDNPELSERSYERKENESL